MKVFIVSRMGGCEDYGDENWDDIIGARTTKESATQLLESELHKDAKERYDYYLSKTGEHYATFEEFIEGGIDNYKITELEVLE